MRILILFSFCLFLVSCKAKKEIVNFHNLSCEEAEVQAVKDADNGNYRLISYGSIIIFKSKGFSYFYENYMSENYNIIFGSGGCLVPKSSICYRAKVEGLILEKYGDDIFEKSKQNAIDEYRKTKEFIEEVKPEIDSGKVYFNSKLHKKPSLIIDEKEMDFIEFLGFADFEVDYFNAKNYCEISFLVEKDGTITDVKFQNAETNEAIYNEKLLTQIKKTPKWNPGIYLEEIVRSKILLKVPLSLLSNYPH